MLGPGRAAPSHQSAGPSQVHGEDMHVQTGSLLQGGDSDSDEFGQPEEVEVSIDNTTTASYSLVGAAVVHHCIGHGCSRQAAPWLPRPHNCPGLMLSADLCLQVSVVCRDRKGLVYDLMRTMKDIEVRCYTCNRRLYRCGLCVVPPSDTVHSRPRQN